MENRKYNKDDNNYASKTAIKEYPIINLSSKFKISINQDVSFGGHHSFRK